MSIDVWMISEDCSWKPNGDNFNHGYTGSKKAYHSLSKAMTALKCYKKNNPGTKFKLWHGTISPV